MVKNALKPQKSVVTRDRKRKSISGEGKLFTREATMKGLMQFRKKGIQQNINFFHTVNPLTFLYIRNGF